MKLSDFSKFFRQEIDKGLPGIESHRKVTPKDRMPVGYDPMPAHARKSAVLVLCFERDNEIHTTLFKRTEDNGPHSGQVAFPGGKAEPTDTDLTHTALRETEEEIGVPVHSINVIGQLTPLYIPVSNFTVQPVVATVASEPSFSPNPSEVQTVITPSLNHLFNPENHFVKRFERDQYSFDAQCINYEGHTIWGATAIILAEVSDLYEGVRNAFSAFRKNI